MGKNSFYDGFKDPIHKITGDAYRALISIIERESIMGNSAMAERKRKVALRRKRYLELLKKGPQRFTDIYKTLNIDIHLASRDLTVLLERGVVGNKKGLWFLTVDYDSIRDDFTIRKPSPRTEKSYDLRIYP